MGIFALVLAYGIGLPVGVAMARNKDGVIDKFGMLYIIFITSVPSLAYIYIFRYLGTTIFGLPNVFTTFGPSDIRSWILPIISLALPSISSLMLWIRRYVVDQMNQDYVKLARAKGVSNKAVMMKHVFRNAFVPMVQTIPSSLLFTIMGSLYVESIYSVPGMGGLLIDVIQRQDNTMVQALVLIFASVGIIGLFLGDILMVLVDPRISLTGKEESR